MSEPEKAIPRWQKRLALVLLVFVLVGVGVGWHRFVSDFWPPDRSFIAPNLVASLIQAAVLLIVGALIWPPTRQRIKRYVEGRAEEVKAEVKDHMTSGHSEIHDKLAELHRCLDHIIEHSPTIPTMHSGDEKS